MLRSFLIYLSKAGWAQRMVTGWSFAWQTASRFVAGESISDAVRVIRELNNRGIAATLDQLGEHTTTMEEATQSAEGILTILDEIDKAGVKSNVSIKLTQIGMGLDDSLCNENLTRILHRAPTTDYIIEDGDSFWKIAQEHLGDGNRYTEILRLNPTISEDQTLHR